MQLPQSTIRLKGKKSGNAVAIFCGVHGNEKAGIMTVEHLEQHLSIEAGTVYLVRANPPAIAADKRFIQKNLNRLFTTSIANETYEDTRAAELVRLLDICDALLDLHSYREPLGDAIPFAICESDAYSIVNTFNVDFIISGFAAMQDGGSDGYMYKNGKPGICVELGTIEKPDEFVDLGIETALRFLSAFGCITQPIQATYHSPKHLALSMLHKKSSQTFKFVKIFKTFEKVSAGAVIATEAGVNILAPHDGYILFPREDNLVGIEAFLFARES